MQALSEAADNALEEAKKSRRKPEGKPPALTSGNRDIEMNPSVGEFHADFVDLDLEELGTDLDGTLREVDDWAYYDREMTKGARGS